MCVCIVNAHTMYVCVHLLKCACVFCWPLLVCYFIPDKNRKNQLASTSRQRKHTKGGVHTTNQPPNNSDLSNLSPTNLPVDDFEPEKEVSEEKEDPLAVRREEGGGRWRKEERGRTKQRMSLEEQGTSAQEETSSRVQTQPVKRGKASMPMREWDSFLYGVWSIHVHVFIADSIELCPGLHHHVDFLHER